MPLTVAVETFEMRVLLSSAPGRPAAPAGTGALTLSHGNASLSERRSELAAAAVGSQILFAGGTAGLAVDDGIVETYQPRRGRLNQVALLSQGRSTLVGVSIGSRAMFAGGETLAGAFSSAVDIYDLSAGTHSTAHLSQARGDSAATSVGPVALFAGGFSSQRFSDRVDLYDARTGAWTTATLSAPRMLIAAAAVGSLALFAGGEGASGPGDAVDIYNASTGLWSTAKLPHARSDARAAVVGTSAIFAGGRGADGYDTAGTADVYDLITGRWTTLTLPHAHGAGMMAVAVGGKALFAGGFAGGGPAVGVNADVDVLDLSTGQWSSLTLSQPRADGAAATAGTTAVVAGGRDLAYDTYDTIDTFADTAPAPELAGTVVAHRGRSVTVTVTNTGDADYSGPYAVQVYATPPHRLKGAVLLGSVTLNRHLAPGASVRIAVPLSVPADVAAGTYHCVAAVARASDPSHPTPVAGGSATFRLGGASAAATRVAPDVTPFSRVPLRDTGSPASLFAHPRRRQNGY